MLPKKKKLSLPIRTTLKCASAVFTVMAFIFPEDVMRAYRDLGTSQKSRSLSINLGGGNCRWNPPTYDVPDEITFQKTLIAGFPSGDKRLVYSQMEALTGLSARDEWEFEFLGPTNSPFIKSNYPHHEGIWGWGDAADQVVMVVRNMRRTMVEYHDILWDIGYATTFEDAFSRISHLYSERPPLEDFLHWRDMRIMEEIQWYSWFIDYWMEGGLMRDIFTRKITTQEHWDMLTVPFGYSREQLNYDRVVGNITVTPTYDPHCVNDVSGGCAPVAIISGERLVDHSLGPAEARKIAQALQGNQGIEDWLIEEEAWECIWGELIIRRKGDKTFFDREGMEERDYNFSEEMLALMITELDYLISKYSSSDWNSKQTAQDLVGILQVHKALIQSELAEVVSGQRLLGQNDFLGPRTRKMQAGKSFGNDDVNTGSDRRLRNEDTYRFDFSQAEETFAEKRREARKLAAKFTQSLARRDRKMRKSN